MTRESSPAFIVQWAIDHYETHLGHLESELAAMENKVQDHCKKINEVKNKISEHKDALEMLALAEAYGHRDALDAMKDGLLP